MRPTERVNGGEARHAVVAGVLERYRAIFSDPAALPGGVPGPDPISQWAATEYSEGPPLAAVVELAGPLAAEEVAALALEVVAELTQVHATGVVHGDLNPSNILLSDGGVRLIHSGIAHTIDGATLTDLRGNPRTVAYLTPEQILGQPFDASADVFALGGVLAFAAVGVPAFGNDEPNAVLYRIVHEEAVLDAVPDALAAQEAAFPAESAVGEQTATFEPVFDPIFEQATDPRLEPMLEAPSGSPFEAAPFEMPPFDAAQFEQAPYEQIPYEQAPFEPEPYRTGSFDTGFDTGSFDTGAFNTGSFNTGSFNTGSFEPAPAEPLFDPALDAARASAFESMVDPVDEPTTTVVTFPAPFSSPDATLTEVPLRDPFEPMPTRRHPRYEPLSPLESEAAAEPTMVAEPIRIDGRPPRRRSRSATFAVLGTLAIVGMVTALVVRSMTHSNTTAAAPPPSVPVMPTAPLPGTFMTGPGCPITPWAMVTQTVAADGGLVTNAGGGAPDCGGGAIAFIKSGSTNPGASSYSWTFHLGWSARCTLSVFIANTAPSSGVATYQLFLPTDNTGTPMATFKLNQGQMKGQWVSAPQLTRVALPGGSVQLRLTDAGAFTGDRFHVTASAVKAACSQVP